MANAFFSLVVVHHKNAFVSDDVLTTTDTNNQLDVWVDILDLFELSSVAVVEYVPHPSE